MKPFLVAATTALLLTCTAMTAAASTATTPASGGTSLSADRAQNGAAPAYTTLGSIVITESSNNDFGASGTLILTAPNGWQFNPAASLTATAIKVGGGTSEISASIGAVTASSITVNITVSAVARRDYLTLSGIQVQAADGGNLPASGNILRSSADPGTAAIVGVTNDVTNFGSLSQSIGALRLHVVLPGQSFVDGSALASSGISGAPASPVAGVAFNLSKLIAADRQFNISSTYSGTKTVAYSGPGGSPSYTTSVSFASGQSTTALVTTLRKAETTALSATSSSSPAISTASPSASLVVDPGPVTKLQILLPGETAAPGTSSGKTGTPSAQIAGVALLDNVRVNAVDANWNVVAGASPNVAIGSSDVAAAIADDNGAAGGKLTLAAGSGVMSTFTFGTGGSARTITANDVAGALSAGTSASVTVNKAASSTSLSSSLNPAVFGQSVTFTATVTGAAGTPAGTVDFKDGSTVIANDIALNASGVATFTTSSLTVNTHTITAVYSGSALYNGSTSANLSQVVNKAGTATTLASSFNPSCAGQPVTLTATVNIVAPGSGVLTGSVDFKDGSSVIGDNISLNGSGVATFTTSGLSATNHNLTAVYNGSSSFNVSTSTPVLVQAVKAKPTASVSGSTSICLGGSASIQAVLGGTGPWTVTWSDGLVQSGVTASPTTRSVSPSGTTTYTVTNVADANCSNSGTGSANVTVNMPPAISAQPSAKSVCVGGSATFTVAASGSGLTYRWRKDGVNLVNGGHVSGATSANLTISSAAAVDAGSYDVVMSGTCPPSVTSNAVSLTVNPIPGAAISAAALLCAGSVGNSASVPDAGPGASYVWSINNGVITGGASTASITFTASPSGSSLKLSVTVTSQNGCSASSSKDVMLSIGGVALENWSNVPLNDGSWDNSTLQAREMLYPEGGTIPCRIKMPQPCVGDGWSITLEYDFADNSSGVHFSDFLTSYNAYEAYVNGHACDGGTCTSESTFPIPADGDLVYQIPGVFTVENGAITSVSAYSTAIDGGRTVKHLTLTGTATPGADVFLLFGAHIARDHEWSNDKGARQWPYGTAAVGFINYSAGGSQGSTGHANVKISDSILDNPSDSDLSIIALDSPDPVGAGHNLSYTITAYNSGPLAASPDTVSDWIPAGTTFVSATTPAGWTMTTPPVGGTGLVRWILPTAFAPSASASFGLVVAVDAGASGTVENTAMLGSGMVDAYRTNNSSHVSTTIISACTMPVVASDPADLAACEGAIASFSASATGTPAPAIQWQVMASGDAGFSDLIWQTGPSLGFPALASHNGNQYRARFTNSCGTVYSAPATLTVDPSPSVSVPANIVVDAAPGQGAANVDFTVIASGSLTLSASSGSAFPVGTTTVTATATNACGSVSGWFTITVLDHEPPVLSLVGDAVITIAIHSVFTDPGAIAIDLGAGNLSALIQVSGGVNVDQAGSYVLIYTVTDPSGNTITITRIVNVVDTAAAGAGGGALVTTFREGTCGTMLAIGTPLALSGAFSNVAAGSYTASWQLDQFEIQGVVNETTDEVSGSYTFSAPGVYLATLTVTDQQSVIDAESVPNPRTRINSPPGAWLADTAFTSQARGATVMVVVFDPGASFVAGRGWIDSPAGALASDPSSAGKASFGFETRGTSDRPAQSEIHFVYGDLVFHSASCDRIVVSGGSAQLTGTGTVNGSGDYAFLLSVVDGKLAGGPDRFRMHITDRTTNTVVYDSQPGEPVTAQAAIEIGCGQIEIYTTRGTLSARATGDSGSDISPASAPVPYAFALAQNSPNPFVGSTRLSFDLPEASVVRIGVYDVLGREVASLVNGQLPSGRHEQVWHSRNGNGGPVSAGVYFVRMQTKGLSGGKSFTTQRRLVLLP